MKTKNSTSAITSRRQFLSGSLLLLTAGIATGKMTASVTEISGHHEPESAQKQLATSGYQETEHIRKYYQSL